jgi:hypothetical protein
VQDLLNGTVKTLNGDAIPIPGARLSLRDIGFVPTRAEVLYPKRRALTLTPDGKGWSVALPAVAIHCIVSLSGQP